MELIRASNLSLAYGRQVLLDQVAFRLLVGQRIVLLGRNGAGKSSLLKILDGAIAPDDGTVRRKPDIIVARLEQEVPVAGQASVAEVIAEGLAEEGKLLAEYLQHTEQLQHGSDDRLLRRIDVLQSELDARDAWHLQQRIQTVMTRLQLTGSDIVAELSGGWRRRVALARALVSEPDVLLLDEPTNHLDIEAIQWLEEQLLAYSGALLLVTHDRAFAKKLAQGFWELDRGHLTSYELNYEQFQAQKAHELEVEQRQDALFDKRLAEEERWIRQGIKARRTRNEGRVRALEAMRRERAARRAGAGDAAFRAGEGESSGQIVFELEQVGFSYDSSSETTADDGHLIRPLSARVMRGDKIGFIGPNGCGKSTLLQLMLGSLAPVTGSVRQGTRLKVAFFEQMRDQLDDEQTVVDVVAQGRTSVSVNGREQHIISYLGDFLFTPEQARSKLRTLSGGERNRVQLACLFSQPANVLVLDEPTNDLDVETLELLESTLVGFDGTILLVTHDRSFLDAVVTSVLAFEGDGYVREYVGGYSDWLRQGGSFHRTVQQTMATPQSVATSGDMAAQREDAAGTDRGESKSPPKKLSYKLQRELDTLPELIEQLETEQQKLQAVIAEPDFYQQAQDTVKERLTELASVDSQLESAYERWIELSEAP